MSVPHQEPDAEPRPGSVATGARATGRGLRSVARGTGRFGRYAVRTAQRAAGAEGAERSGLARLIELGAFNAAGDAALTISLAGTLFFKVPADQARGQVSLFLGLTMLPFAIVAPLIGPFLDRFRHGRRWAIGATMAIRAFLAWVLAGAVVDQSAMLFPAALGCLVASKAYNVTRAAAVPRILPEGLTLVKANARTSMAGVVGAVVSAPIAGLASLVGPEWSLRYTFLVFVLGTIWAVRLPARVDSSQGEESLGFLSGSPEEEPAPVATGRRRRRGRMRIPPSMAFALRANCGPRWLSGFLTMFMAFLLRANPIPGYSGQFLLAAVVGAAGFGNFLGIGIGSVLRRVNPRVTVVLSLLADAAAVILAALFYGLIPLVVLGLVAGLSQSLAKLSLDSTIQRDVPERIQTSAFARSDTTVQLAWVIGGFVGIALPLHPRLGLSVAAVVLIAWTLFVLASPLRRTPSPSPS
jgi:MFS family permease